MIGYTSTQHSALSTQHSKGSPMLQVTFRDVYLDYGGNPIFDAVDLEIVGGDRIGLVGENGSGKSSLLKLIAGLEVPSDGTITRARNLTIGYLPQETTLQGTGATIFEAVAEAAPEIAALAARLRALQDL